MLENQKVDLVAKGKTLLSMYWNWINIGCD